MLEEVYPVLNGSRTDHQPVHTWYRVPFQQQHPPTTSLSISIDGVILVASRLDLCAPWDTSTVLVHYEVLEMGFLASGRGC